jgi:crotonobetainyl-CoA:carnitine CoA-transferase CaiB-like acyl-CoA transferase
VLPLEGIKVLDLSRILAGPWCTQTLADLGAEVWKIEEPRHGDDTRSWRPPEIGGESTYFQSCNRSKRSVAVDLKAPEGRDLVRRLALRSDVLVENFRRGALDRYGLGPEALRRDHPALIYCSISGYGRTGSRADEAGYDFAIQAESGLMAITGEPDGRPMKHGIAITDIVTGMNATQAILAALLVRARTGKGQLIDASLFDSAVALLANVGAGFLGTGADPRRFGNAHATIVPYQSFETADGVIALAVGNDLQYGNLCRQVLGRPDLAADPRFATNPDRVRNRDVLVPLLAAVFRTQPTGHWIEGCRRAGVPAGQVRSVAEVFTSPEVAERGLVEAMPDARHGRLRLTRSPLRLSETPTRRAEAPPRLGEHTAQVLSEELGLSGTELARLGEAGIVRLPAQGRD